MKFINKKNVTILLIIISVFILIFIKTKKDNNEADNDSSEINNGLTFNNNESIWKIGTAKYTKNPILSGLDEKSTWDKGNLVSGNCIIKNDKGETILFYYATKQDLGKTVVGFAKSLDGINFERTENSVLLPGNDGDWDDGGVSVFPNCITQRSNGDYYMYYTGFKKENDIYHSGSIGMAISKDLVNWEKYENNPIVIPEENKSWDSLAVFEPSVIFSGNEFGHPQSFKMWYGGSDDKMRFQIGYAESFNGYDWKKYENNPVLSYGDKENEFDRYSIEVHSVTKINNKFVILYEAIEEEFPSRFSIGLALSKDGKNWHKSKFNPVLEGGMTGEWDAMGAYHPSLVVDNDRLLIYYVGLNFKYDHQIGVAEINPNSLNFNE